MRQASSFAGQSTLKTWVFAILRNRIIESTCATVAHRDPVSSLVAADDDWQEQLEALFKRARRLAGRRSAGGWRDDPEGIDAVPPVLTVFETRLDHLPPATGRVS